jgi:putative aminopeptidase FrvX
LAIPQVLHDLLSARGPSGYESEAAAAWREAASAFADVSSDTLGSSFARVKGTGDGPVLVVVGHIDEIGLIVTHIDDQGLVWFRGVGGWSPETLVGQRLEILTRDGTVPGVVARDRPKPRKPGEERRPLELEQLHIDIGARDGDDARARVRSGDVAVIAAAPVELPNGRVASRALDNRLGAYVALETARLVAEGGDTVGDVVAIAAVQEEVGDFGGARTSVFAIEPQIAIAVDVTPATDYPGGDPKQDGDHGLGSGAAISRGSTISPKVFELLYETAEAEGIAHTIEVSAGETHTDMDAMYASRVGLATGLVSIPTRYLHTPTEVCSLDDVEACARLIAAFARRLEPDTSFAR